MASMGSTPDIEESEYDIENAKIAREKFDYLKPQLEEAENTFIETVNGMNDSSEYQRLGNEVQAGVSKQFGDAGTIVTKNLAKAGIDPTSGKYQGTLATLADDQGTAGATAINASQTAQQDRALSSLGNVVAMGEGESASAIDGMYDVAQNANAYSTSAANSALKKAQSQTSTLSFAAGVGYESMQGDS